MTKETVDSHLLSCNAAARGDSNKRRREEVVILENIAAKKSDNRNSKKEHRSHCAQTSESSADCVDASASGE